MPFYVFARFGFYLVHLHAFWDCVCVEYLHSIVNYDADYTHVMPHTVYFVSLHCTHIQILPFLCILCVCHLPKQCDVKLSIIDYVTKKKKKISRAY